MDDLSIAEAERLDAAADRFEQAWRKNSASPPKLEDYLESRDSPALTAALREELSAIDLAYRDKFATPIGLGQELGHYRLGERIGRGGMGEVFRAHDSALGRDVAIKVIHRKLAHNEQALARFDREARALASLDHPNILTVHDFGRDRGVGYFVTELLEGETLRDRIARGKLPIPEATAIAIALAEGLAAAHAKQIVHRDLKPQNVFLEKSGGVKILDFGLALSAPTEQELSEESKEVLGSRAYMSPEQTKGGAVDAKSDLWSFGCVLLEMTTGERKLGKNSKPPAEVATLIGECLAENPAERIASAEEILRRLKKPQKSRVGLFAGLTLIFIAIIFGATELLRPEPALPATNQNYLQGRKYLDREGQADYQSALERFERAIEANPRDAKAHAGVADAYLGLSGSHLPPMEAMKKARDAAERALALDPQLAEARASWAVVQYRLDWDWAGAEASFRAAIKADPRSVEAHQQLGRFLMLAGRPQEANAAYQRAQQLDPLRRSLDTDVGANHYYARSYADARQRFLRVLAEKPGTFMARWGLAETDLAQKKYGEAIIEFREARRIDDTPEVDGELAFALAKSGSMREARAIRDGLVHGREEKSRAYISATAIAVANLGLGQLDQMFAALEQAVLDRDEWLVYLAVDPIFDEARGDPRFSALLQKVGPR